MSYYEYKDYKVYYRICGKGEPLFILHGNTASSKMLEEEVAFYSKYFKVIIMDLIGHGKSGRLEEFPVNFWIENAKVLNSLCKKLNINKVNILGTSGGAIIALNFAINYPGITKRVIADSFQGETISIEEAKAIKKEREKAKNSINMFWNYMQGEDWEKVIDSDTNMLMKYAKKYRNYFHDKQNNIECPMLITGSLKDNLINDIEKKLCNVSKKINFSITLFASKGDHPLMLSNKKFFRKVALNFLREDTFILEENK